MLYDVNDNFKLYTPRIQDFVEAGRQSGMRPAIKDADKNAVVFVDEQVDFVMPDGNLPVPGAQNDLQRAVEWFYGNMEFFSTVVASLDTHTEWQIFYTPWWVYADNQQNPAPWTMIVLDAKGQAVDANDGRRMMPVVDPIWSMSYLKSLRDQSNKALMLWPFHCMEGSSGRDLMPSLREAFAFYASARHSQVNYITKGTAPTSEHYGIWKAEVVDPRNPATALNTQILDLLASHKLIYILGQAKSHCVLETVAQTMSYFKNQPDVIKRLRFVMDAMSSVQHPAVDFDGIANAEFAKYAKMGAVLVSTNDPIR